MRKVCLDGDDSVRPVIKHQDGHDAYVTTEEPYELVVKNDRGMTIRRYNYNKVAWYE